MSARRKILMIMLGVLAVTGVWSIATGAAFPKQVFVEVTSDQFGAQNEVVGMTEVPAGGILTMILGSNPATGFSWNKVAQIGDEAVLQATENKYSEQEINGVVGAGGRETWTFKALEPGTTTIRMEYSQPWADGEKAAWTFQLTVVVR